MQNNKIYKYEFFNGNVSLNWSDILQTSEFLDCAITDKFGYITKSLIDNIENLINESENDDICYDFYSYRDDRMLDFKLAVYSRLQKNIDDLEEKVARLNELKYSLGNLAAETVEHCINKGGFNYNSFNSNKGKDD